MKQVTSVDNGQLGTLTLSCHYMHVYVHVNDCIHMYYNVNVLYVYMSPPCSGGQRSAALSCSELQAELPPSSAAETPDHDSPPDWPPAAPGPVTMTTQIGVEYTIAT